VVRSTLARGRASGFAAAAGAAVGNISQATAAGLGLAVLFARFPSAILILRVFGAAYLAWLGGSSIVRIARGRDGTLQALTDNTGKVSRDEHRASFRQGLTVNLLNPAIATFYLVVVPSFMPAGAPRWYYALLASLHVMIAFACHGMWAVAFDRVRHVFRVPAARRTLEAATGVAMLGLAVRVLLRS
jgi:threonine/homoserine/homoserine lactone efflux protein